MSANRLSLGLVLTLFAVAAVAACENGVVDPPDDEPAPQIALIDVTSSLDTLLATGSQAQASATARDQNGAVLANAPAVTWSSSDRDVVRVGGTTGQITTFRAGTATVTATAGGVSGTIRLVVIDADMAGLAATAGDAYAGSIIAGLAGAKTTADDAWTVGAAGIGTGNLVQLVSALNTLQGLASDATGHDRALLAVLSLYLDHMYSLLNF